MTRDDIKEAEGKIANEILQEKLDLEREYIEAEARRLLDMQHKQAAFTQSMQRQLREFPQPSAQVRPFRGAGGIIPNPAGGLGPPPADGPSVREADMQWLTNELRSMKEERDRLDREVRGLRAENRQLQDELRVARDECFFLEPVEPEQNVTLMDTDELWSAYQIVQPALQRGKSKLSDAMDALSYAMQALPTSRNTR